jgi:cytochrome c-type biogenesis protein CcmF
MEIAYLNEHLGFGKLGQLLVIISFTASLLAAISYFFSAQNKLEKDTWKPLGRIAFSIHGAAIIGIFGLLFYLIYNHYFEYYYVWHHSSTILPMKYMFACFWEGQEGSFLLWTFWHVVLSGFIIFKGKEWESPVMTVISVVQVFLSSMLLGVVVFGYKLGSDPFILLREHPEMANLPFIKLPNYLSRIADGRGLNPLLQNYWMVIHPPVLFLGFASTLIPFAYAIAGLWKGKVTEWIKPALPWTFFGVMILGTGILMGAAWAYESLSFGGFWAWDPVENASLVPWLTFVAAAHVMLIYKHQKHSVLSTLLLTIFTFLLILYSTFLTRSGILGNTSVHAFTDLGMSGQLLVYMLFFIVLAVVLIIINWKKMPRTAEEEKLYSREFWMFIGALVLVISCIQITFTTSIPVINKLFNAKLAPPVNIKDHYNKWQLPIAVILALLIAVTQFFKYKDTPIKGFLIKLAPAFFISVAFALFGMWGLDMYHVHYVILLWASAFAILANADYFIRVLKGKVKHSGASIAHIGFGLILMGVLISNAKSEIISHNNTNVDLGKELPNSENVMLFKGDTAAMGGYYLSYKEKVKDGVNIHYEIEYFKPNNKTSKLEKVFSLKPIIQTNPRMGNVAEPDTKHYLTKDVYTHISYVDPESLKETVSEDSYKPAVTKSVKVGDTITTDNSLVVFTALNKEIDKTKLNLGNADIAVGAKLSIIDINKKVRLAEPIFIIKDNTIYSDEAIVDDLGLRISFNKIHPETGKIDLAFSEKKNNSREFIVLKAIVFPYINLLWTGAILMIIGTIIAIRKRLSGN